MDRRGLCADLITQKGDKHGLAGSEHCSRGNPRLRRQAVSKIASSVAVMAEHMKTMDEKIDEMQSSVSELTAKPGKRWDAIIMAVATAIVAGLVAWALAHAGLG